jgi:PAS domain S-box-containing protein
MASSTDGRSDPGRTLQPGPEVFRAVVESCPSGMLMVDSDGKIVLVNSAIERIFGYERHELLGQPVALLVPLGVRERHAGYESLFARDPGTRPMGAGRDMRGVRKDGLEIPVEIGLTPVVLDGAFFVLAFLVDISERMRAQREAEVTSLRYHETLDAMIEGCQIIGPDWRYRYVNTAAARHGRVQRDKLVGRTMIEVYPGIEKTPLFTMMQESLAQQQPRQLENEFIYPDGSSAWFELRIQPVPEGLFILSIDITERKLAEVELLARERELNAVVESVNDIVFEFDQDFRYVNVWTADERKLAEPKSELTGKTVVEVLGETAARPFIQRFERVLRTGVPETFEYSLTVPAGNLHFVASIRRLAGAPGAPPMLCMGISDITVLKEAQDALHASDLRLRALFEAVHLIVLGLDADASVDYVNPYFLETTGYSREEVIGQDWFQFLPEAGTNEVRTTFRELLEHDAHTHYRNPILTRDGTERLIAWHNTVTRDAQGRATGTLSIGEDITEHVRLEEQFRQAQKMEAVGQLAGGIAHDFNNLLSVITGYSELVHQSLAPDDPRREDLGEVRAAVDRAAALTRQLLAFSRRQVLQPRVLSINDIVAGMEKMLRRTIGEDVMLTTSLASELPGVYADAGQLEQVIVNLAVNARDAMPGGGRITIETSVAELDDHYAAMHADVRPGQYVLMTCSDTGQGMDETTRSHIFEPFFTTKEPGRGTGLGLATVFGIMKQSEGHVAAYSEAGRGTTMHVYLPAVHDPLDRVSAREETVEVPGGTETVLLVEDESALRNLATSVLRQYGYTVLPVRDGAEAVALCRSHPDTIHLMLTDIVMPEMSGPEAAQRVRSLRPDIKVLFMSGYADRAVKQHRLLDPNVPFLHKPFTPSMLAMKTREVLDA